MIIPTPLTSSSASENDQDPVPDSVARETHYYWPDTVRGLSEIRRVLRPGGTLLLIAEAYRGERFGWVVRIAMIPLRAKYLTPDEHRSRLEEAGFINVSVDTDEARGWICATGNAPG